MTDESSRQVPLEPEPPKKIIKFTPPLWKQRQGPGRFGYLVGRKQPKGKISASTSPWGWVQISGKKREVEVESIKTREVYLRWPKGEKGGIYDFLFQNWLKRCPQLFKNFGKSLCFLGGPNKIWVNIQAHLICWEGEVPQFVFFESSLVARLIHTLLASSGFTQKKGWNIDSVEWRHKNVHPKMWFSQASPKIEVYFRLKYYNSPMCLAFFLGGRGFGLPWYDDLKGFFSCHWNASHGMKERFLLHGFCCTFDSPRINKAIWVIWVVFWWMCLSQSGNTNPKTSHVCTTARPVITSGMYWVWPILPGFQWEMKV